MCDSNRVVIAAAGGGGSRGRSDKDGGTDRTDKNMSALKLDGIDGILEKDFKSRNEFLVAKNNTFMTEEELKLFKEDYIKKLIEKERRKKFKLKDSEAQTKLTMARDPFLSMMNNLENPPALDTGRLRKLKEKKEAPPVSLPVSLPTKPPPEEPKEKPAVTRKFAVKNVVRNLPD